MSSPLLDHLAQEEAAIGQFIDLLDQEAAAMTHGNFSDLPQLANQKSQLADQIVLLSHRREMEQVSLGYAAGRSGADAIAAAGGEALQTAWHDLRERAALAHQRNHRNGVMIHTHLDFTRQSISFLQAKGQPLYGPDGTHSTGAGSGNSLAVG